MTLKVRVANPDRFKGEFFLEPEAGDLEQLPDYEQKLCQQISKWMDSLASLKLKGDGFDPTRLEARDRAVDELRKVADAFVAGEFSATTTLRQLAGISGRDQIRQERIGLQPFGVSLLDGNDSDISQNRAAFAEDLLISVNDVPLPEAQVGLKIEIDRAIAVIKVVLAVPSGAPQLHPVRAAITLGGVDNDPRTPAEVAQRRSRSIRTVWGIARVGLESHEPSVVTLADKSLDAFREEFVAAEAGGVKNRYLRRLGLRCLRLSVVAVLLHVIIRLGLAPDTTLGRLTASWHLPLYDLRNFLLLFAGVAVGTWLSFALRRVILNFLDLATLEEDRLDPSMRVLFVAALGGVVGLLLATGSISVGLGKFQPQIYNGGISALLLGLLLGIAERTIATAVYRRASDFGGAVGGK